MANVVVRPGWHIPERLATREEPFLRRREFLRQLGFGGWAACWWTERALAGQVSARSSAPAASRYPAARNAEFNPGWRLTNERTASSYNNFYEFSPRKDKVRELASALTVVPWPIEIGGLVGKPLRLDVAELVDLFDLEERVYRLRCVEAWAMIVPWTGFPLRKLLEKVEPHREARFVRFVSFNRPDQAPGLRQLSQCPWPYVEGLRIEEALHPLTMLVSGAYGKPLPRQHGAPLRLIVPWKYGYKSIKSIVRIELVPEQPATFWETLVPAEYPFESNVDSRVPHPRWSQATERLIDTGDRVRTRRYNGYGSYVASLYQKA